MINFNFQSLNEVNTGLVFEFALPSSKDDVNSITSKYLTEDAFGFIEGFIHKYVPDYQNWGHWGQTEINRNQWLSIKAELLLLKSKLELAQSLNQIKYDLFSFRFIQEECLDEIVKKFAQYKMALVHMLDEFISWIDNAIQTYGSIYILGI